MEASPLPTPARETWTEEFARSLAAQRERVREFLAAQAQRINRIEAELAEQLRQQQDQLQQHREELHSRQGEVETAEERLCREQRTLALARQESEAELEHLASLRRRLTQRSTDLDAQQEQLATQQAHTESQRRRIAQEFRTQHEAHFQDLQRRRAELEQLKRELADRPAAAPADLEELQQLCQQRQVLLAQLDDAQRRLAEAEQRLADAAPGSSGAEVPGDLQRCLEKALDDLRQLNARNAELEEKLSHAQSAARDTQQSSAGSLDWEAEKRRVTAMLEGESEQDGQQGTAARLRIEDILRTTERVLAEKDREIQEIKQILQNHGSHLQGVAIGAAALGELLDKDELIREERANLKRLQKEWEEMLRQAEIDLSLERAKISRQRAEIEEKLRALQSQSDNQATGAQASGPADKPGRRRWLTQLGLKDPDSE